MVPHSLYCAKSKTQEVLKFAKSWPGRRFSARSSLNTTTTPSPSQILPRAIAIILLSLDIHTVVRIAEHRKANRAGTRHLLSVEPHSHSRSLLRQLTECCSLRGRATRLCSQGQKNPTPLMKAAFVSVSDMFATSLTTEPVFLSESQSGWIPARHAGDRAENSLGMHARQTLSSKFTYPPGLNND